MRRLCALLCLAVASCSGAPAPAPAPAAPEKPVKTTPAVKLDPCLRTPLAESRLDPKAARDFKAADARYRAALELLDTAPEEAWPELEAATRLDPRHGFAQLAAGEAAWEAGQPQNTIRRHLAAAVQLLPKSARAQLLYARFHQEVGELDVAERHLRCAIELKPELREAQLQLARLLISKSALAEAEALLRENYGRGHYTDAGLLLADVLVRKEKLSEAAALFEELAASRPEHPNAVLYRRAGRWYQAAGDSEGARRAMAAADRIDPPPAKRRYRPLRARRRR